MINKAISNETNRPAYARLCLVTAVPVEFKAVANLLTEQSLTHEKQIKICRGRAGARQVTSLQIGMGARGFDDWWPRHLAAHTYDAVIVVGLGGALDPQLHTGDGLIYDLCYDARLSFPSYPAKEKLPTRDEIASIASDDTLSAFLAIKLQAAGLSNLRGAGVTVGQILVTAIDKHTLGARCGAAMVDMESYDVLAVCAQQGLPATALRIVSDEAGLDLPDFNRATDARGQLNHWRLAQAMVARPHSSWHFLRQLNPALQSLRKHLRALLTA
jgi:nucleoside phosphorylase